MRRLTAVVITLNEEAKIESCLKSLANVADEIIVADTGSTDSTKAIINNRFPSVKLVDLAWKGYSDTKNAATSLSSNDLILSLDADEVLSYELRSKIIEFKSGTKSFASFNRLTNYCGRFIKYCGWYPDRKLRIYDRKLARWEGIVHERISPVNDDIIHLKGDCLHYSIDSIEDHIRTLNIYSSLSARELYDKGRKGSYIKLPFIVPLRFLYYYIIKRGALDGYYGGVISALSAYAKFIIEIKLIELNKQKNNGRRY